MKKYYDADDVKEVIKKLAREPHYQHEGEDFYSGICAVDGELAMLTPTEAVSEKEHRNLEYTLLGVMHSVDKWLDGDELEQDEVNRAITMREKTLRIIENLRAEIVNKIFDELADMTEVNEFQDPEFGKWSEQFVELHIEDINALREKYMKGDN